LTVEVREHPDPFVVRLAGEIDLLTSHLVSDLGNHIPRKRLAVERMFGVR
jgi:hypothetical protein